MMKKIVFCVFLALAPSAAMAAMVTPVWTNDTSANAIFFNDSFGHQVTVGTYNPSTGVWTTQGVAGGFVNLSVSGNATIAGTLGVTGPTTLGALTINGTISGTALTTFLGSPPAIGNNAPNTGAFTNLSATGTLTGTAFTSLISAPPVGLGSVTPSGVAATTLSASGVVSGAGFANYLLSPPAIGNTAPNTGKFTTLVSTGNSTIAGVPFGTSVAVPSTFSAPNEPGIVLAAGVPLYIAGNPTSSVQDTPAGTLYVSKDTNFTGVPATGSLPAIYGFNNVHAGAQGPQVGVLGYVVNANTLTSQPGGTSGAIGTYGIGNCNITACTATWGGVIAAYDTTSQANPTKPLVGLEVDNYAHDTDSSLQRIGIQIVAGTPDNLNTLNTVGKGLFFAGSGAIHTGQFTTLIDASGTKTTHGIVFSSTTFASGAASVAFSSPGYQIDGLGNLVAKSALVTPTTFAGLGTCNSARDGERGFITDDLAGIAYRGAANGGGSSHVPVVCINGAGWLFD